MLPKCRKGKARDRSRYLALRGCSRLTAATAAVAVVVAAAAAADIGAAKDYQKDKKPVVVIASAAHGLTSLHEQPFCLPSAASIHRVCACPLGCYFFSLHRHGEGGQLPHSASSAFVTQPHPFDFSP